LLAIDKNLQNNFDESMKIKDKNQKKDIMEELMNAK
jgi:hypothetical protein